MIKSIIFYKTLFASLIFVSLFSVPFEAVILLSVFIFLLLIVAKKTVLSKSFFEVLAPLILLFLIALSGIFYNNSDFIDFIKDFLYLLKPILFLVVGYLLCKRINDRNSFLILIVNIALVFGVVHIIECLLYIYQTSVFSIHVMRNISGRDNFLELIAIGIIIANLKNKEFKINFLKPIIIVLSISFVLYLSRTMFILLILISLTFSGYLRLSMKGLRYLFLSATGVILFYVYLFSIDIDRASKSPVDNFLYKLKLAPSEIFVSKGDIDIKNHANLWDHWRAYEGNMAINQLNEKGAVAWTFGTGMGALIDLKFNAPLSDDPNGMRYISLIHNGYVFILFKTGILGLILYFLFLISNYFVYKKIKNQDYLISNMIFGITLFYFFTTLVITGIFNLSDPITLVLGGVLFFSTKAAEYSNNKILRSGL